MAPPPSRHLDVFQPLQLGGVKGGALQRHHQGFSGCIRNLQLDTQVARVGFCLFCCPLVVTAEALSDNANVTSGLAPSAGGPAAAQKKRRVENKNRE